MIKEDTILMDSNKFGRLLSEKLEETESKSCYLYLRRYALENDIQSFIKYFSNLCFENNIKLPVSISNILTYDNTLQVNVIYSIMLGLITDLEDLK